MDSRLTAIFRRRSVRAFTGAAIAAADLQALLEAGMAAPSARNLQPWHFVVVTDRRQLEQLAEIHPYGKMLANAGAAIAVCGDTTASPDFWIQDCSAATENILIAAAMLGLGTCWLGMHPRAERVAAVRTFLAIPEQFGILSLIAVGVPAELPEPRTQYDGSRVHHGRW